MPKTKVNIEYGKKDETGNGETRFIERNPFPIEAEINIFGNKTAFFFYRDEEIFATVLESKTIANSMRSIFNIYWEAAGRNQL